MQDRPTASELLAAVQDFLRQEVAPVLGDQRQRFRLLIAANVLAIVQRELHGEEERLRAEWTRLAALLDASPEEAQAPSGLEALRGDIAARREAVCRRIRAGDADAGPWRRAVFEYARWSVEEKLRVCNPRYLERFP